jgi:hypothetical protein
LGGGNFLQTHLITLPNHPPTHPPTLFSFRSRIVLSFVFSNILPLIVNILEVLNIELKPLTETSNLLVTLNSSVNVFIYIIFGEKFQRQFLEWIR